jgi:hypothetical protein
MNNEKHGWIWAVVILLVLIGLFLIFKSTTKPQKAAETEATSTIGSSIVRPYGDAALKLGESANFKGITITPLSISEDSRCATGVQCIQAGTVRVNVATMLADGTSRERVVSLGATTTLDTFSISLTGVTPYPASGTKISDADYRLTFRVHQSPVVDEELIGK